MDSEGSNGRVEELEAEVERLRAKIETLREERDRAVKAQDALLEKVIPLAVPGGSASREGPSTSSRVFTLMVVVMLLVAIALAAHYFPRIVRSVGGNQQLPPSVRVQPPQP